MTEITKRFCNQMFYCGTKHAKIGVKSNKNTADLAKIYCNFERKLS